MNNIKEIKYNGNIRLSGNNLLKELNFKIIYLLPLYFTIQIINELRYSLFYIITFFLRGEIRKISLSLYHEGYYLYKNFYDKNKIRDLKNNLSDESSDLIKDLSYENKSFKKFSLNEKKQSIIYLFESNLFKIINFIITSKYTKIPSVKYSINKKIDSEEQHDVASHAHFDSYLHETKVLIALDDINENNGPTLFLPRSGNFKLKYFKQYFVSWLKVNNLINQNKTNLIGLSELNKKSVIKFCLKQGDAIIFDSRFLHRASHITEGERKVLWLYY